MSRRRLALAAGLAAALVGASACTSAAAARGTPSPEAQQPATVATTHAPATKATTTQPQTTAATVKPKCATIVVWLGVGNGGGAAGSQYVPVEFTNLTKTTCTLTGYPKVWAALLNGSPVGLAAGKDTTAPQRTVTLKPGATEHTLVRIENATNFPPATCQAKTATALKISPPGVATATVIPMIPFQACSVGTSLKVQTVQAGVGVPGQ